MDLYAYVQIEDYDALAKANGIEIPRLRGYEHIPDCAVLSENAYYQRRKLQQSGAITKIRPHGSF